jgi:hypothetical protein
MPQHAPIKRCALFTTKMLCFILGNKRSFRINKVKNEPGNDMLCIQIYRSRSIHYDKVMDKFIAAVNTTLPLRMEEIINECRLNVEGEFICNHTPTCIALWHQNIYVCAIERDLPLCLPNLFERARCALAEYSSRN